MTQQEHIKSTIAKLEGWKENRDKCSARRTHGGPLNSQALIDAIELLPEEKFTRDISSTISNNIRSQILSKINEERKKHENI